MKSHDMLPRDAVVSFQCSAPDLVKVSETIGFEHIQHQEVRRDPNVVDQMEAKYIFYARHAETARKEIMRGHSCVFNVYFREP
jgi:hypothetical protein